MRNPSKIGRLIRLRGRVQGVNFRDAMCTQARHLGVVGWVRNRSDGSVESFVGGEAAALEAMLRWAQRGPPLARVEAIEVTEAEGDFSDFQRWPTV